MRASTQESAFARERRAAPSALSNELFHDRNRGTGDSDRCQTRYIATRVNLCPCLHSWLCTRRQSLRRVLPSTKCPQPQGRRSPIRALELRSHSTSSDTVQYTSTEPSRVLTVPSPKVEGHRTVRSRGVLKVVACRTTETPKVACCRGSAFEGRWRGRVQARRVQVQRHAGAPQRRSPPPVRPSSSCDRQSNVSSAPWTRARRQARRC